jgi:pyrrolysine biosynthesis protein PylC
MKVAVVGGKLQGIEAAYLAQQAGWEVLLIDRKPQVPAIGLAHSFVQADVTADQSRLERIFQDIDLIVPTVEDLEALTSLDVLAARNDFLLAYDSSSYAVTSSKRKSEQLFHELALPLPQTWPKCSFPLIMKPENLSGSQGIRTIGDKDELALVARAKGMEIDNWIVQEYLEGPSYSLEVLGMNGRFITIQPTFIDVDFHFDCKRVLAPVNLPEPLKNKLDETARLIANSLGLRGIMDIEVIQHGKELKVLEIDARLPSQTPTAVLHSTGINMLELLYNTYVNQAVPEHLEIGLERNVIFEHIKVTPDSLEILGEHIMTEAGPLTHYRDFFGADEALTDFVPEASQWVATLIIKAENSQEAIAKHDRVIDAIRSTFHLPECVDTLPIW